MKYSNTIFLFFISFTISAQISLKSSVSIGGSSFDTPAGLIETIDKKILVAGTSSSTDLSMSNNMGLSDIILIQSNTEGEIEWIKNYGGTDGDTAKDFIQSKEGGYLLVGGTKSSDFQVTTNRGQSDVWIVKLNTIGDLEWQLTVGDTLWDDARNVIQNSEGDYLILSRTNKEQTYDDYLVTKVDQQGNLIWNKEFGGSLQESPAAIHETSDGYLITGTSGSSDLDVSANNGIIDYWVLKIDFNGNKLWDRNYGGHGAEFATSSIITNDGNIIITGRTHSNNPGVDNNDCWIIKINQNGELLWDKKYGGSDFDNSTKIIETDNEELLIVGYSSSSDGDLSFNDGKNDFWLLHLNKDGDLLNSSSFGGSGEDRLELIHIADGKIILAGSSYSNDFDLSFNNGFSDIWFGEIGFTTSIIESSREARIKYFPNPTNGALYLEIDIFQNESVISFSLFTLDGQLIKSTMSNELDVSALISGYYIACVKTSKGNYTQKVFVGYGM